MFCFNFKKRIEFFLFFFLFFICISFSQNCVWSKSNSNPGAGYNEGSCVYADNAGNVYITGTFQGSTIVFGTYTLTNYGIGNVFLVKYDLNGNVQWAKSGQGTSADWGYSVTNDVNGNIYITGAFQSPTITFGTYTLTSAGGADIYLVKYDSNGNVIWAKSEGAEGTEVSYSVKTDQLSNVYISGYSTSSVLTIGTSTFSNSPGFLLLVKYDSNGNVIWAKSAAGGAGAYAVTTNSNGEVYITGGFGSQTLTIDTFTLSGNGLNFFICKLDNNGNVLWAKNASGGALSTGGFGYSLAANTNGDVFVTGTYDSPNITLGSYTLTKKGGTGYLDAFLAKYDSNGNVVWAKSAGGIGNDIGYSVACDISNVYFTGRFNDSIAFGTTTLSAPTGAFTNTIDPMYFARFDFNGNLIYATSFASGGGGGNNQNWVCTDNFKNVYIASDFQVDQFSVGCNTLALTGTRNVFVAKYNFPDVGLNEPKIKNAELKIYPNPANDKINIELSEEFYNEDLIINVIDATGSEFLTLMQMNAEKQLDINNLPAGIYLLKIKSRSQTVCNKFVVER